MSFPSSSTGSSLGATNRFDYSEDFQLQPRPKGQKRKLADSEGNGLGTAQEAAPLAEVKSIFPYCTSPTCTSPRLHITYLYLQVTEIQSSIAVPVDS